MTILIVDDDDSIRWVTAMYAQTLGYQTIESSNGKEALEVVAKTPVDVVITDYHMPHMTGAELIEKLQAQGFPGKVIGMSGGLSEPFCNPFLVKPFSDRALRKALGEE